MNLIVLGAMLSAFFLFCAVFEPLGVRIDEKRRRLGLVSPPENNFLNEELRQPFLRRFLKPVLKKVMKSLVRSHGKMSKTESKLAHRLKLAGIDLTPGEFTAVKSVAQLVVVSSTILLAVRFDSELNTKLLIVLSGALLAVIAPNYLLKSKITTRRNAIRDELPSIMDLLVVSVEAGLGFDGAILQLYEKRRKSPLMHELVLPVRDVQMGLSRRSALKNMGDRNEIPELKVLSGSLIQAEQLGVSIKSVLVSQAEQLRVDRKQRIEAQAMKAPVKMMLPTVAFIFPVMFIILLAPAVLKIIGIF